jgi:hypothetical protein
LVKFSAIAIYKTDGNGMTAFYPSKVDIRLDSLEGSTYTVHVHVVIDLDKEIKQIIANQNLPVYKAESDPTRGGEVWAWVENLTEDGSKHNGGLTPVRPSWWPVVQSYPLPSGVEWQRGHLYPEKGGGEGSVQNLIALTDAENARERPVDAALAEARRYQGSLVMFHAKAEYGSAAFPLAPTRVVFDVKSAEDSSYNVNLHLVLEQDIKPKPEV